MRITCTTFAALLGMACMAWAQTPVYDVEWTTHGRVHIIQSNYGITGYDIAQQRGGLVYPGPDGWQYLFASGMWIGGIVESYGEWRPRVIPTYEPTSGTGWAIPGEHKNGPVVRPDLAEQYQVRRTTTAGMEVLSTRYHLGDTTRYEGGIRTHISGLSDLDIREWLYAFDDEAMADVIVRRYEFINTGLDTIHSFAPAWVLDPDIGDPVNPQQAAGSDRHRVLRIDDQTVFYTANDDDGSRTGELGFAVLEMPPTQRVNTIDDGGGFINVAEHAARYSAMTSGKLLSDMSAMDIAALYSLSTLETFAPGDTLRYTTAFVMMSPAKRQELLSGGAGITQYYADAAATIRGRLNDMPTSVKEQREPEDASISIAPHPVGDRWTLTAERERTWVVSIYDVNGQVVYQGHTSTEGTLIGPPLAAGVYHVVARSGEMVHSVVISSVR